jgi:hypothetical protein
MNPEEKIIPLLVLNKRELSKSPLVTGVTINSPTPTRQSEDSDHTSSDIVDSSGDDSGGRLNIETKSDDEKLETELQMDARLLLNQELHDAMVKYKQSDNIRCWITRYHDFLVDKKHEILRRVSYGHKYCIIVEPDEMTRSYSTYKRKALEYCLKDLTVVKAFRFPDEHGCILLLFDSFDPVKAWSHQLSHENQKSTPLILPNTHRHYNFLSTLN